MSEATVGGGGGDSGDSGGADWGSPIEATPWDGEGELTEGELEPDSGEQGEPDGDIDDAELDTSTSFVGWVKGTPTSAPPVPARATRPKSRPAKAGGSVDLPPSGGGGGGPAGSGRIRRPRKPPGGGGGRGGGFGGLHLHLNPTMFRVNTSKTQTVGGVIVQPKGGSRRGGSRRTSGTRRRSAW